MSEREIRGALKQLCNELDLHAGVRTGRRVCQVFVPAVLGAGVAVSACDDDSDTTPTGATATGTTPGGTTTGTTTGTTSGTGTGTASAGGAGGMTATGGESGGMGGAIGGAGGATGGMGMGGAVLYMAPDA